jgi:hypothetical protein
LSEYYDARRGKGLSEEEMLSDSEESTQYSRKLIEKG